MATPNRLTGADGFAAPQFPRCTKPLRGSLIPTILPIVRSRTPTDSPSRSVQSSRISAPCALTARASVSLRLPCLRYTPGVMPAATGIGTVQRQPSSGSAVHFLRWSPTSAVSTGRKAPTRARYATAVWDFMLDQFKPHIAMGVPAFSCLRTSLTAPDGPDSGSSPWLMSVRLRRGRLLEPPPDAPSAPVVAALRVPPWQSGGFVQLGSI